MPHEAIKSFTTTTDTRRCQRPMTYIVKRSISDLTYEKLSFPFVNYQRNLILKSWIILAIKRSLRPNLCDSSDKNI